MDSQWNDRNTGMDDAPDVRMETAGDRQSVVREGRKYFSRIGLMYFCGTLIIYAVQLGAMTVVQLVKPEWMQNPTASLLVTMIPMYAIAMPLMIFLITRVPADKVKKDNHISFGRMILAFMMCYAVMYASNLIGTLVTFLIGLVKGSNVDNTLVEVVSGVNPAVSFFLMVLCAPVLEELVFRKLLIDRAVRYGEGVAVLLSGLMFGLFHGNLSQFAYAFTIGLFLAFLYVKTGRIRYTIILHMIINFLGSIVSLFVLKASRYGELMNTLMEMQANPAGGMDGFMKMMPQMMILFGYVFLVLGVSVAGIVLLIVNHKKFRLDAGRITLPKGKRFSAVILNVGMILFTIFWLIMIIAQLLM